MGGRLSGQDENRGRQTGETYAHERPSEDDPASQTAVDRMAIYPFSTDRPVGNSAGAARSAVGEALARGRHGSRGATVLDRRRYGFHIFICDSERRSIRPRKGSSLSKRHILGAAALASAVAASSAFAASDPVAAVKADLAKLQSDVVSARTTIVPDAQKLAADAAAAKGSTRAQARAAIKPDLVQLRNDVQAARTAIKADRAQLKADLAAAKGVNGARKQLRPVIKSTRTAIKTDRTAIRDAVEQARQAVKDLRSSFSK